MPAIKYSHNYSEFQEEEKKERRYQSVPIKKEHTSSGKKTKSSTQSKIDILNNALLTVNCILALVFATIYSVVAISETKLSDLHTKISELNYENIELENKLENVKSYYSVDTKVSSTADFDKAKNVLEVNHVDAKLAPHQAPKNDSLNAVTGF